MSEPIFAAGNGAAAPVQADPQPEKGNNRKALLALGAVLGAVVVGGGAFFFLNQSSSGDEVAMPPKKPAATEPEVAPSPSAKPTKAVTVKTATVTSHDPFAVLFPEEQAPSGSGDGTTPDPGTSTPAPDASAPVTPPDQSTSTTYKVEVTIIKQDAGVAQIQVNGKPYSASVGKDFGQYFTLYAIFNSDCVGVLFGDQNVPVCKGSASTVAT
ncbi:hypothetical protein [Longivirga aurantiaca]|uniref:Uncharacterized protein n=1 Tax=Longivirga aurantiaca TaxID=1837743 RepID=A0ABW1T0X6_9ACTN